MPAFLPVSDVNRGFFEGSGAGIAVAILSVMTPETNSTSSAGSQVQAPFAERAAARIGDTLRLGACAELDWITVRTLRSVYDVIVLSGDTGAVMIRGGDLLPEFCRATITGSLFHAVAIKPGEIAVGLKLEFVVDGRSIITSPVQEISRHQLPVAEGTA